MPHLQFEINRHLTSPEKISLAEKVTQLFSDVMDTGIEHVSMSIREFDTFNLFVGRVKERGKGIAIVNADIREGRSLAQRRTLALGFIDLLNDALEIPKEHIYVTITEHKGEDFHLVEKFLSNWQTGEDPMAD